MTATPAPGLRVVPDRQAALAAVRAGHDSMRVVVLDGTDEPPALEAARQGLAAGRGPLPVKPYDCGHRCLVAIPTYNERDNLAALVRDVLAYLQCDVLIVDDASPDGTGAIARRLSDEDARVHVLQRTGKQGLGTAYLAAFHFAEEHGYGRVFQMDADFSHPPWDLPLLAFASRTADLVVGSRYVRGGSTVGWDFRRRLLSRGANLYARTLLRLPVRDTTAGFRAFDVARLRDLDLARVAGQGYVFQIEMAYRCARAGFRIVEVPIHFTDRRLGASKMDSRIAREAMLLVPKLARTVRRDGLFRDGQDR